MAREDPHFRLRLPADLKAEITAAAARHGASINAEIVDRLRQSFTLPDLGDLPRQIRQVADALERLDDIRFAAEMVLRASPEEIEAHRDDLRQKLDTASRAAGNDAKPPAAR